MAFKLPTIAQIINKMTDEEKTFLTNVLNTTQVTEWEVIQTLPETKEICMAVMQIPKQRSCIGILWNNSKNDYYLIDIFSGYQTPIYHIVDEVITPVAEYCTTLEVRYWLTNGGGGGDNDYINQLKEVLAVNGLDVEFGRNVEIDGNAQVNGNLNVGGYQYTNNDIYINHEHGIEFKYAPDNPNTVGIGKVLNSNTLAIYEGNSNNNRSKNIFIEELPSGVFVAYVLTNVNTKTLFGNQSIYGSGNIDLYEHLIQVKNGDTLICNFVVISSSNVKVDSVQDFRTVMGQNTFHLPIGTKDFIESTATTMSVTIDGTTTTLLDKTFTDDITTA